MINFVLWKWNQPGFRETYTADHVNAMANSLRANCLPPHKIYCITDQADGICPSVDTRKLWPDLSTIRNISGGHLPSCYRRLKIFDNKVQSELGIPFGERIVSLDLDALIIRKDFGELFNKPEKFVGWHVLGHRHPKVLNGSMFMFTAGEFDYLWREFDPVASPREAVKKGFMGSDQGYLSHRLIGKPDVGAWTFIRDGVASYVRDVRIPRVFSEAKCRVVFFAGSKKPWHKLVQHESPWIKRYAAYEQAAGGAGVAAATA